MKRILFYAAAIAAMAACSEAMVEDITPEVESEGNALHEVTISATTSEEAESRATIDDANDNWVIKWEATDALLAVQCSETSIQYTLTLDSGAGTSSATFTGSAPTSDYFLIYPATCGSQIDLNTERLAIDLTSQSNGANSTFMISDNYVASSDSNPSVTMKQIGAIVDLTMNFPDNSYDGATIESIEVSGFNSKCSVAVNTAFSDPSGTKSTITITDGSTTIASQKATARFNIIATTIATNDEVTVTAYVNNDNTVTPLTTTLTADSEMNFARAQHHTIGCTLAAVSEYWTDEGIVATLFSDKTSVGTSADDPIEISTAAELALIAKNVNAAENALTYSDTYFKLKNDIDLTGYKWEAIGTSTTKFQGTFDGNSKTITGLYINESTTNQGLFGVISGATIENLTVSGSVNSTSNYAGGIVGYSASPISTIENCHNSCSVTTTTTTGMRAGGIVGNNQYADITNCSNSGAIYAEKTAAGGIAGYNYSSTIDNCYNTGSVTGANSSTGGVVGYNQKGNIKNSYNAGVVDGTTQVGGVVGYLYGGEILNCYNTASVTGSGYYVGGVVGQSDASSTNCNLYNSYNRGSVKGSDYVGGVVGQCLGDYVYEQGTYYSYVKNCYSASDVKTSNSGSNVGGVIGQIESYSSISYCYWDNSLWNDNTNGYGSKLTYQVTFNNVSGYSTADMTDGTTVVNLLKDQTSSISGATWKQGADGYPTLDL